MAKVKYYLKSPNASGVSLISLYLRYGSTQQVVVSTNCYVDPKDWDAKTQRLKRNAQNALEVNNNLKKWEHEADEIYNRRLYQKLPLDPKYIKPDLEKLVRPAASTPKIRATDLLSFVDSYITSVKGFKNVNTIRTYNTHLKLLRDFAKASFRKSIAFSDITLDFYLELKDFMTKDRKFNDNTMNKHTGILKFFLNEATERGLNKNFDYRSRRFTTSRKEVYSVYLNADEINAIRDLDLSSNPRLDKVRDLFVIGCYSGLRFSDLSSIQAENISPDLLFLRVKTIKTEDYLEIPVHPFSQGIMLKYRGVTPNSLPPSISNQRMNDYLKEIAILAGISEEIPIVETKGGVRKQRKVPKHDLVTCHTARRSFATNEYLAGTPTYAIMSITGHKTEKAFLMYIKVSKRQYAQQIADLWKSRIASQDAPQSS